MEIKLDVYYWNKTTKKIKIIHETILEDDILAMMRVKHAEGLTMFMDDDWKIDSINVDKIEL